jgi:hypothetical protein
MKRLFTGFTTTRNIRAAARAYRRSTQRTARLDRELSAALHAEAVAAARMERLLNTTT